MNSIASTPPAMDPFQKGFQLHGRNHWIHSGDAAVHDYAYSYGVTLKEAANALGVALVPEENPLYMLWLQSKTGGAEKDIQYLRGKLWGIIDDPSAKNADKIRAIESLVGMTQVTDNTKPFGHLKFEELLKIVHEK